MIKSRRMRWAGNVAIMGEKKGEGRVLLGKLKEKILGKPKRRWEDNIKMYFKEVG
jgi:hypothetical protein